MEAGVRIAATVAPPPHHPLFAISQLKFKEESHVNLLFFTSSFFPFIPIE
jgi:hypothetical protein